MIVSANSESGYLFSLSAEDFTYMPEGFKSALTPADGGLTFKGQGGASGLLIIGQEFCSVKGVPVLAKKTYTPKTKFSGLYDHKVTVSSEFGNLIAIAEAATPKVYNWIKSDGRMFIANHVPQLFMGFQGSVITGIDGVFDWKKRAFFGSIFVGG